MNLLSSLLNYTAQQIAALRSADTTTNGRIDTTNGNVTALTNRMTTAEGDIDSLDAQLATAISAVTVDSEVQNIRVGDDQVTYTSAGEAVRTQFSNVKSDMSQMGGLLDTYVEDVSLTKVTGQYINGAGRLATDTALCYALVPVIKGDVLEIMSNPNGTLTVIGYSPVAELVSPIERITIAQGVNVLTKYEWTATADGYAVISGKPTGMSAKRYRTEFLASVKAEIASTYKNSHYDFSLKNHCSIDSSSGEQIDESGYSATDYIDISDTPVLWFTGFARSFSGNAFYDENKDYLSGFTTYADDDKNYVEIPADAKYVRLSGYTATMQTLVLHKPNPSHNREYDVYIASEDSLYADIADFVCKGNNDDDLINAIFKSSIVNRVWFYGDSTFSLNAPIVLKSGMVIKSNGATFTQPAMVTTPLSYANTDTTSKYLRVPSTDGFKAGQYVYIQDDNGQNIYNIIETVNPSGNPSLVFKYKIDYQWSLEANTVIKTANPCFVLDHIHDVVIDGVHIDWNVAENPIQTYNPSFLQEGISIQYSQIIFVKNCKIENGGRRGICSTDGLNIYISDCFIRNWHEHAIDIFNGYTSEGNTRENPMLNNCIINNVICTENKMHGIQLHRGSGVIVTNCVSYANEQADISMAEYAHDNIVSNCFVHDGFVGIIVRGGSFNNLIKDNIIKEYSKTGIWVRGTSDNRGLRNTLSGNKISNIVGDGINIEYSDYCRVESNELFDVSEDMSLTKPIICALSGYNAVINNMIRIATASSITGIRCAGAGADYNVVKGNIIENCGAPSTTGSHDVVADNIIR